MDKIHQYHHIFSFIFTFAFSLSLLAFAFCIVAEFKKSKVDDVKLDGRLCRVERSEAFGFGIGALVCFSAAQIIGNFIIFMGFCSSSSGNHKQSCRQAKSLTIATALLVISWLSFGIATMLMSAATSMNRKQAYGKGWLNGECYLVKDGIFSSAAILVLLSLGCTLASSVTAIRTRLSQVSTDQKPKKVFASSGIRKS